jgi:hypothetical protein
MLEQANSASLMNISIKLMNENSMRAVNTDTKQMMMNTSRAVAYPTCTQHHTDKSRLIGKLLCIDRFFCQFKKLGKRSIFTGDRWRRRGLWWRPLIGWCAVVTWYLGLGFAAESDGDDGEDGGGALWLVDALWSRDIPGVWPCRRIRRRGRWWRPPIGWCDVVTWYLGLGFAAESDGDDGEDGGGTLRLVDAMWSRDTWG